MKERSGFRERALGTRYYIETTHSEGGTREVMVGKNSLSLEQAVDLYTNASSVVAFRFFDKPLIGGKHKEKRNPSGKYFIDGAVFDGTQFQERLSSLAEAVGRFAELDEAQVKAHDEKKKQEGNVSKFPVLLTLDGFKAHEAIREAKAMLEQVDLTTPDTYELGEGARFVKDRNGGWHKLQEEDQVISSRAA